MIRKSPPWEYAQGYARLGWRVYPVHSTDLDECCTCGDPQCSTPGKHPLIRGFLREATSDRDCIRNWWSRWPWANVGRVLAGEAFVLDIDRPGVSEFGRLCQAHAWQPQTLITRTGGGGWHFAFSPEPGLRDGPLPGLGDIRTQGPVLLPPSRHASGMVYAWHSPGDWRELPQAPRWLIEEVLRRRDRNGGGGGGGFRFTLDAFDFADAPGVASPGRTHRLWTLAGRFLAERGLDEPTLIAEALAWNDRNRPPLSRAKVRSHCQSLIRQERRKRHEFG